MDINELALIVQENKDRSIRNEGRVKKLEGENQALHELAKSMAVMAEKQNTMGESVERLEHKVDDIEGKPGKRWDSLVDKALAVMAGAFLAWLASGAAGV